MPKTAAAWPQRHELARRAAPAGVLMLVVAALQLRDASFLTPQTLTSVATSAAPVLLLSTAVTLTVLLGGIDLSVGAMTSLASVLLALWVPDHGWLGVLMVLACAAALGALQGLAHAVLQVPSFVVTLGGLGVFSGLALKLSDASTTLIDRNTQVLDWLNRDVAGVPASFAFALAAVAVLGAALRWLPLGRRLYAVGSAERAAVLAGVRAARVRVAAFALSSTFAAMAGWMLAAQTSFGSPTLGDQLLLPTIAAAVVGGTAISGGVGGLWAAILGALIITTTQVGTTFVGLDPAVQGIAFGVAIVIAVGLTTDRRKIGVIK